MNVVSRMLREMSHTARRSAASRVLPPDLRRHWHRLAEVWWVRAQARDRDEL